VNTSAETDVRALIDAEPLRVPQYVMFAVLFLTLVIDGMDTQITSYIAPSIAREWGVSMANLGLVFSAGLLGSALGALGLGALGDAIGPKRVVIGATLLVGVATLALSTASSVTELAVLRFITGIGVGGSLPNLIALASQLAPTRLRATVITWTGCGFPAGAAFAGVLASALLPSAGWRVAYQVAGAVPLLLLPFIVLLLPESIPKLLGRKDGQRGVRSLLRRWYPAKAIDGLLVWPSPAVSRVKAPIVAIFQDGYGMLSGLTGALFFLSLVNVYFLANWLPGLLQQANSTAHDSIVATTLFNVGGIFGAVVLGRCIDRFGFLRILTVSLTCVAVFMLSLAAVHYTTLILLISAFVGGFFVNGSQGALYSVPALIYPDRLRATATGWAVGVGRVGFVGPLIAGLLLSAQWSYAEVLFAAAIAPAAAVIVVRILASSAGTLRAATG
jgi:AAHS family 4-hydroxybenzoate transporter-like MFS transporter